MPLRYVPLGALAALLLGLPARAQQLATDSPSVPDVGACVVEAWADDTERWGELTCGVLPRTRLELDAGWADEPGGRRPLFSAATRVLFLETAPGRVGLAVDAEVEVEPDEPGGPLRAQGTALSLLSSYRLPSEAATLFGNVGWVHNLTGDRLNELAYGTRLEVPLGERFVALAEAYGEGYDVGYQAALRWRLVPDLVSALVGYGGPIRGEASRNGLTLGLAWSPPAFFGPRR